MPQIPTPTNPNDCTWATAETKNPQSFTPIVSGSEAISEGQNANTALLEVLCRYAFGGFCVLEGLAVDYDSASLNVTIGVGLAAIDGIIPVSVPIVRDVPESQPVVNLWLKQDGTCTYALDDTPPAGKAVYIGQLETDADGVINFTDEGVVYGRGGSLWRTLSEAPTDTPPDTARLFTQVADDLYVWDGSAHRQITLS